MQGKFEYMYKDKKQWNLLKTFQDHLLRPNNNSSNSKQ